VLGSGDEVCNLEVRVPPEAGCVADNVPVAWYRPPARAERLEAGSEVVVMGLVRRRFFRTPSGAGSRTEVVAEAVEAGTTGRRVQRLLTSFAERAVAAASETGRRL
jgi:single-strand DNA-binding protein